VSLPYCLEETVGGTLGKKGHLATIIGLTCALYLPIATHPFSYDDISKVQRNERLHTLSGFLDSLATSGYSESKGRLIPNITLFLTYQLCGSTTWPYHVTNLLIHLITACLLYRFVRLLLASMRIIHDLLPLYSATVFALHPLNTEAVNYCNARPNTLCTLFYLLTCNALLSASRVCEAGSKSRRGAFVLCIVILAVCTLLCKEMGISLVVMAPILLIWLAKGRPALGSIPVRKTALAVMIVAGLVIGGIAAITTGAGRAATQAVAGSGSFGDACSRMASTIITQGGVAVRYVLLGVVPDPRRMSVYHDVPRLDEVVESGPCNGVARVLRTVVLQSIGLLAMVGTSVFLFWRRRKYPLTSFLWLWIVVTLLPTSLIPRDEQMVEYRTYLSMVGGSAWEYYTASVSFSDCAIGCPNSLEGFVYYRFAYLL